MKLLNLVISSLFICNIIIGQGIYPNQLAPAPDSNMILKSKGNLLNAFDYEYINAGSGVNPRDSTVLESGHGIYTYEVSPNVWIVEIDTNEFNCIDSLIYDVEGDSLHLKKGKGSYYAPRKFNANDYSLPSLIPNPRKYDLWYSWTSNNIINGIYYYTGSEWKIILSKYEIQDIVGNMIGETSGISIQYNETEGTLDYSALDNSPNNETTTYYKQNNVPSWKYGDLWYSIGSGSLYINNGQYKVVWTQPNWTDNNSSSEAYIKNKPNISKIISDSLNAIVELDPIFASDSNKIIHWSDTLSNVATQYDLTQIPDNDTQDLSIDSLNRVFTLNLINGGSVKWKDSNPADSTIIEDGYGTYVYETTTNNWIIEADTNQLVTPYDLTQIPDNDTQNLSIDSLNRVFTISLENGGSVKFKDSNSGGTVTSVTASAPVNSSGGNTPNISVDTITNQGLATQFDIKKMVSDSSYWNANGNNIYNANSGNVGIGTTSPGIYNSKLDVVVGATPINTFAIRTTDVVQGSDGTQLYLGVGASTGNTYGSIRALCVGGISGANLILQDGSNNVGIGTTNPVNKLDVVGSMSIGSSAPSALSNATINIIGTNDTRSLRFGSTNYGIALQQPGDVNALRFVKMDGSSNEIMRIEGTGNVGIGTNSPNKNLELYSTSGSTLRISNGTANDSFGIEFYRGGMDSYMKHNAQTGVFKIASGRSVGWGGSIKFATDVVNRMELSSSGVKINSLMSGLVKSTNGILQNAVAGTDYIQTEIDGSNNNETITNFSLSSGGQLKITEAGVDHTINSIIYGGNSSGTNQLPLWSGSQSLTSNNMLSGLTLLTAGSVSTIPNNSTNWNTAYDWGNWKLRLGANTTSGVLDWNDATNTRPGTGETLLLGNATNGFGVVGKYYHSWNLEYITKDGTGNILQMALPYYDGGIRYRGRYSGTWSAWKQIWTSEDFANNSANWNTAYTHSVNDADISPTNEIELPAQSGNGGKYLQTNGTTPSWQTAITGTGAATQLTKWTGTSSIGSIANGTGLLYNNGSGAYTWVAGALPALTDGKIWIGNSLNAASERALSGDATMDNMGVVTVGNDSHTHNASTIIPDIVSSVEAVANDGGNIDLVGDGISITGDDANNNITFAQNQKFLKASANDTTKCGYYAWRKIKFNNEIYDTGPYTVDAGNNTIQVPSIGYYEIETRIKFYNTSNTNESTRTRILVNGEEIAYDGQSYYYIAPNEDLEPKIFKTIVLIQNTSHLITVEVKNSNNNNQYVYTTSYPTIMIKKIANY